MYTNERNMRQKKLECSQIPYSNLSHLIPAAYTSTLPNDDGDPSYDAQYRMPRGETAGKNTRASLARSTEDTPTDAAVSIDYQRHETRSIRAATVITNIRLLIQAV